MLVRVPHHARVPPEYEPKKLSRTVSQPESPLDIDVQVVAGTPLSALASVTILGPMTGRAIKRDHVTRAIPEYFSARRRIYCAVRDGQEIVYAKVLPLDSEEVQTARLQHAQSFVAVAEILQDVRALLRAEDCGSAMLEIRADPWEIVVHTRRLSRSIQALRDKLFARFVRP